MIRKCQCEHKSQDSMHGKGMRVFNVNGNKDKASCTVCGNVVSVHSTSVKEKK